MKEYAREIIRFRRKEIGLSLRELSKTSKVDKSVISRFENGKTKGISLITAIKLCSVLELDIFQILEVSEDVLIVSKYFHDLFRVKSASEKEYK